MLLDRAMAGGGGMLFITGAPGIGASRLASEVAGEAASKGWLVLSGRCMEQDGAPYAPFREILASAVAGGTSKSLQDAAGGNGPLLSPLLPSLPQKVPGMPPPTEGGAANVPDRRFPAAFQFL